MKEEWRPITIEGYEYLYEVSNTGKVRSVTRVIHKCESNWRARNGKIVPREFDATYKAKEIQPCRYTKKNDMPVYHLHKRVKDGYYGQTDIYVHSEELVRGAFPELYEGEIK